MRSALNGLDLAAATQAIENGRLINPETGNTVPWHTPKMILPVSQRLSSLYEENSGANEAPAIVAEGPYRLSDGG